MPARSSLFRDADLGGGVRLHLYRTRAFKTITARVAFSARLDAAASARAMVPRVLGRGTRRLPSLRALQVEFDRLFGASLGGEARRIGEVQTIQFRGDWVTDRLAGRPLLREMGALMGEFLREPALDAAGHLRDEIVVQERKILHDEAKSVFDDKARYARHRLLSVMCRNEPFSRPSLGHLEEIDSLTRAEVERAHRDLLERAPVDLFLVGDLGWGEATRFARGLGFHRRKRIRSPGRTSLRNAGRVRTVREDDEVTQAKLEMGFRTRVTLAHPLYPAMVLCNALFGGSPIGKLFKVVREQASLCYSIGSAVERTKGILYVHAGIEADRYAQARRLILAQLAELQEGKIAPEAEEQARRMLVSSLQALRDSPGGLIDFALERAIQGVPADLPELLRSLDRVSTREIARAARTLSLDTVFLLSHGRPCRNR